jgi:2-isopropylmalate synthase
VGFGETRLVLGKHSGRHAFKERLKKLGIELSENDLLKAFERFKDLADKKKEVFDEDLLAIVEDELVSIPETYKISGFEYKSGKGIEPHAAIELTKGSTVKKESSAGDGPVDACYRAIEKITGIQFKLVDYSLKATTAGKDALGEVSVRVRSTSGIELSGRGASTDIIEASAKAYVNAVNKFIFTKERRPKAEL